MNLTKQNRRKQDVHQTSLIPVIVVGILATGALTYYLIRRAEAKRDPSSIRGSRGGVHLNGSVFIERSSEEIYNYWRNFEKLPEIMTFLDRVEERGADLSHWVISGPKNSTLEWDSEVINDLPNERISWQSIPGSDIRTWGEVQFKDDSQGRGTNVLVDLYFEPSGKMASAVAKHFLKGLENAILNQNLRDLKSYMETGEIPAQGKRSPNGSVLEGTV